MSYEIIDNFLPEEEFEEIRNTIIGPEFPWYMTPYVSNFDEIYQEPDDPTCAYYFTNTLFDSNSLEVKPRAPLLMPVVRKLGVQSAIRIKANLYPSTSTVVHHPSHTDLPWKHCGAIFYLNTNNGFTVLDEEDGVEVESVANRMLIFDASKRHHSTTCSDQRCRINVNFNYMRGTE